MCVVSVLIVKIYVLIRNGASILMCFCLNTYPDHCAKDAFLCTLSR